MTMQETLAPVQRSVLPDPRPEDDSVRDAYARLRAAARREPFPSLEAREASLDRLVTALQRERETIVGAIAADFGARTAVETLTADVLTTIQSLRHARKHLRAWAARRPVPVQWYMRPSRAFIEPQPLGVVGVIAPWNYPVNLALAPLGAAIAAGNRVILKPSEITPRTAALLERIVGEALPADLVAVVKGGADVARAVAALPLDHLLFTGSTAVGKHVARAAAENLVPVTLELGGKSPAIVHPSYDVARFAERVAAGKLLNAGQTCIAPDYVLVPRGREELFVSVFTTAVRSAGEDLTTLVHERALGRTLELLEDARRKGATILPTTELDRASRRMTPVLVLGADDSMRVMNEEIFGPILPVLVYDDLDRALEYVRARPRPLALYYFDDDAARIDEVLATTVSGGVCINDTIMHFAQDELPFGGVGASGMGRYHGAYGFETFSHLKGVFQQSRLDPSPTLMQLPRAAVHAALDVLVGGRRRRAGE